MQQPAVPSQSAPQAGPLVLSSESVGKVVGETVVVPAGTACTVEVEATNVVVQGTLTGRVTAANVDVDAGGAVVGEVHADILRCSGRIDGVSRARNMLVRKGATVLGHVISERMGAEAEVTWAATSVSVGDGRFMDKGLLRAARENRKVASSVPETSPTVPMAREDEVPAKPEAVAAGPAQTPPPRAVLPNRPDPVADRGPPRLIVVSSEEPTRRPSAPNDGTDLARGLWFQPLIAKARGEAARG